ncbi:hypothetical protein NMY22_g1401 [Coprinellus aureogranulatus]|nr:hypothetical protein NMY22_g1401 [Coprinellus aureogranulatus]
MAYNINKILSRENAHTPHSSVVEHTHAPFERRRTHPLPIRASETNEFAISETPKVDFEVEYVHQKNCGGLQATRWTRIGDDLENWGSVASMS